jgi:hypothetical protein
VDPEPIRVTIFDADATDAEIEAALAKLYGDDDREEKSRV